MINPRVEESVRRYHDTYAHTIYHESTRVHDTSTPSWIKKMGRNVAWWYSTGSLLLNFDFGLVGYRTVHRIIIIIIVSYILLTLLTRHYRYSMYGQGACYHNIKYVIYTVLQCYDTLPEHRPLYDCQGTVNGSVLKMVMVRCLYSVHY